MAEKQKRSTKKVVCSVQLSQRESQTLDEICKYSKLTKSDAIRRALKYYYDDYCPCNTEQKKTLLIKLLKKVTSMALNFLFLFRNCLYPKMDM